MLKSLNPKPNKGDPLTNEEKELLKSKTGITLTATTLSLMIKLGLANVDPKVHDQAGTGQCGSQVSLYNCFSLTSISDIMIF